MRNYEEVRQAAGYLFSALIEDSPLNCLNDKKVFFNAGIVMVYPEEQRSLLFPISIRIINQGKVVLKKETWFDKSRYQNLIDEEIAKEDILQKIRTMVGIIEDDVCAAGVAYLTTKI